MVHPDAAAERFERVILESIQQILAHPEPSAYLAWAAHRLPALLGLSQFGFAPDEGARLGHLLATLIWNATPLPTNGFQPKPIAQPEAEVPCPCGSGLAYGACCGDLAALPPLSTELVWELLIEHLPEETLRAALDLGAIPEPLLARVAERWLDEDRPGRAVALLEPLFAGTLDRLDGHYGPMLDVLCDAYDRLDHRRKKLALLERVCTEGERALRATAWQQIGLIHLDAARYELAHAALIAALRCDPNNPGIPLFEIALLTAEGRNWMARERARFWLYRLRHLDLDLEGLRSFLESARADPQAAILAAQAEALDPALLELHDWLAVAMTRPLPGYRVRAREPTLGAVRRRLRAERDAGLARVRLETINEPRAELRPPPGMRQLERDWRNLYRFGKPDSTHLSLAGTVAVWSNPDWLEYLLGHPELADSLEVLDDLATALDEHPDSSQPWIVHALILPVLERAWAILQEILGSECVRQLPWSYPANRSLLRLVFRRYLAQIRFGRTDEAALSLETLLRLNPSDHQGARAELMNLYLRNGQDEEALALARRFPEDRLADLVYGEVLALYRLGREEQARRVLQTAIRRLPRVPVYLTRKHVRRPRFSPLDLDLLPEGEDQAWLYREAMRDVWLAQPGAIAWLRRCLARRAVPVNQED